MVSLNSMGMSAWRCAVIACSLAAGVALGSPELGVAADGSGQFRTVQEAVDRAPAHSAARFVIHIKPGVYRERAVVPPEKTRLTLRGEDARTTLITFDL